MSWVAQYWVQFLFGLVIAFLGYVVKKISAKVDKQNKEYDALKAAVTSMLHDDLYQNCKSYLKQGYIPIDESDEVLDNLNVLYTAYHNLGGNGTGKKLYEKTINLPIK